MARVHRRPRRPHRSPQGPGRLPHLATTCWGKRALRPRPRATGEGGGERSGGKKRQKGRKRESCSKSLLCLCDCNSHLFMLAQLHAQLQAELVEVPMMEAGGCAAASLARSFCLLEEGMRWKRLSPDFGPPPRRGHTMTYEPTSQSLVVFGGPILSCPTLSRVLASCRVNPERSSPCKGFSRDKNLSDTWIFDLQAWGPDAVSPNRAVPGFCGTAAKQEDLLGTLQFRISPKGPGTSLGHFTASRELFSQTATGLLKKCITCSSCSSTRNMQTGHGCQWLFWASAALKHWKTCPQLWRLWHCAIVLFREPSWSPPLLRCGLFL